MQESSSTGGWPADSTNLDLMSPMATPRWRVHDFISSHKTQTCNYSKQKTIRVNNKHRFFRPQIVPYIICGTSMTYTMFILFVCAPTRFSFCPFPQSVHLEFGELRPGGQEETSRADFTSHWVVNSLPRMFVHQHKPQNQRNMCHESFEEKQGIQTKKEVKVKDWWYSLMKMFQFRNFWKTGGFEWFW